MTAKTERLNLRCSEENLETLRHAAALQGQDLTSFILGAAMERARTVVVEDHVLRLTPFEIVELEKALAGEPRQISPLRRLVGGVRSAQSDEPEQPATR